MVAATEAQLQPVPAVEAEEIAVVEAARQLEVEAQQVEAALRPQEAEEPLAAVQPLVARQLEVEALLEVKAEDGEQVVAMRLELRHCRPAPLPMDRFPMHRLGMQDPGFPADCRTRSGPKNLWISARRTSAKTIRTRTACPWVLCSFTRTPNRERLFRLPEWC